MSDHPIWTLLRLMAAPWKWVFSEDEDWFTSIFTRSKSDPGVIVCPHCKTKNDLYILSDCRCGAREYGNRLSCSSCGAQWRSFNCDHPRCGATIYVK